MNRPRTRGGKRELTGEKYKRGFQSKGGNDSEGAVRKNQTTTAKEEKVSKEDRPAET